MLHAGLTGGIGSGKSTVAAEFARLGAVVLDADDLVRELTGPGSSGAAAVERAFGPERATAGRGVDRAALAALVFGDDRARRRLEAILHPMVLALRRERLARIARERGPATVVVTEAALILEAGTRGDFDCLVVVTAPEAVRRARLAERGMDKDEVKRRMRTQWDDARKAAAADFVVDNGGDREATRRQVEAIWSRLQERLSRG